MRLSRLLPALPLGLLLVTLPPAACSSGGGEDAGSSSGSPDAGGGSTFCGADSDCATGSRCRGGVCAASECATREDCLAPLICADAECVNAAPDGACAGTEDCPVPYLCDGFSRRCFNPTTGEFLGGSSSSSSSTGGSSGTTTSSSQGGSSSSSSSGGSGAPYNLGGWRLDNVEATGGGTLVIPSGTQVPRGGMLVIARDCSRTAFEGHWGVTLDSNVVFLNAGGPTEGVPIINGGEKYSLYDAQNHRKDGPTMEGSTGKSFRRIHPGSPGSTSSWTVDNTDTATPGATELATTDTGVFITEWADASGGGNYVYEFIELFVNP
ncbi:MAG: hypothetical protein HY904_10895 [Deltaproteobacteria bacterium]|nr:hypothetical protein [Deltaproteobacteria bacterium]